MSLAVICCHFNPCGFHEPRRNLLRFLRQLVAEGVPVFVAELAYDEVPFLLPEAPNCFYYRCSRRDTMWHKENLLNLAVSRLPEEFDKVAWIDPDIWFSNLDWYNETEVALDCYGVVQLFENALWTDRNGSYCKRQRSSAADRAVRIGGNQPGFAWAARRGLWLEGGGLCDQAIVGAGDAIFAMSCLGGDIPAWFHYPDWRERTERTSLWARANGGCGSISGTIVHEWHGDERGRNYRDRHLLVRGVDIDEILERRDDGLLQFSSEVPDELLSGFRRFFVGRQEDGAAPSL